VRAFKTKDLTPKIHMLRGSIDNTLHDAAIFEFGRFAASVPVKTR
jgi:hypothetical protein